MPVDTSGDRQWWSALARLVGYTDDEAPRFAERQVAAGLTAVDGIRMFGIVAAAERVELEDREAAGPRDARGTLEPPE